MIPEENREEATQLIRELNTRWVQTGESYFLSSPHFNGIAERGYVRIYQIVNSDYIETDTLCLGDLQKDHFYLINDKEEHLQFLFLTGTQIICQRENGELEKIPLGSVTKIVEVSAC